MSDWRWDETLYAGSAPHYAIGRMPYPSRLAGMLRDAAGLDGSGRLLDVGCGPGSLTLLLAPLFDDAVGIDADAGMIAEARAHAAAHGLHTITWRRMRGEELPGGLGTFRVATFAQSFHWMDQPLVARRVRGMLSPDGAFVHVSATTDRGVAGDDPLVHPRPPWDGIAALIAGYLGPVRRAGQGLLPQGTRGGEDDVLRDAGFTGPQRVTVTRGQVRIRTPEEIVSAVYSHSGSAPHLFGDRLPAFEADLRRLLGNGPFAERLRDVELAIWRR